MEKQIIALGGGGFYSGEQNYLLDDYILHAAGIDNPRICFLPTASGDAQVGVERFYDFFRQRTCDPSHLSLFRGTESDIEQFLLSVDIIYVGGGNTRNMLVLWKEWGVDKLLYRAYHKGILLCGVSAGAICWFSEGVTDSVPGALTTIKGLGMLPGSYCPHFDSEPQRRPVYLEMIEKGMISNGIAADDHCALHFRDGMLYKTVAVNTLARAYRITKFPGGLLESVIRPHSLDQVNA